jgi:hypothetical protein
MRERQIGPTLSHFTHRPSSTRLLAKFRDHKLWEHMNAHVNEYSWPRTCSHLFCKRKALLQKVTAPQFENDEELQFHLVDEHGFSRTRPGHRDGPASATRESSTLGRKRTSSNGDETLEWMPTRYFESASMALSTFATEGDERLPNKLTRDPSSLLRTSTTFGLHDAELTPEPKQPGCQWVSTCDSFGLDGETTDPDPGSDTLFPLSSLALSLFDRIAQRVQR